MTKPMKICTIFCSCYGGILVSVNVGNVFFQTRINQLLFDNQKAIRSHYSYFHLNFPNSNPNSFSWGLHSVKSFVVFGVLVMSR